MANHCLETSGLTHRFSESETVLDSIDLRVNEGSIYGFLGPNGAGKTTTLRLVLGLLKRQKGSITIFGKNFQSDSIAILKKIGSLIETPSLYAHLTAKENLLVLQKLYQCPTDRIQYVLNMVGLPSTGNKKAGQFSLGMKQRLGIAVALLHEPSLLILDEPTNGLDPNSMIEVRELLKTLNREHGITILISSHLLAEIERLVSHVGIINKGKLLFQGTLQELSLRQSAGSFIAFGTDDDQKTLKVINDTMFSARIENGRVVIQLAGNEEIAMINRRLVDNGIGVHGITAVKNDLETIFMDMINN